MFQLKKASRANVKLRIGFWGPSGSGKTMSALRFAKGLVGDWNKIAVLDTENGSGELYSHLGEYLVCPFPSPHSPQRYVQAIKSISDQGIDCLIIDSISHEWEGDGGCLEIQTKLGGRYQDWAKVTPMHQTFVQTILNCPFHVIVTGRSKVDYSMDKDDRNRTKVLKQGTKVVTREGFDYEMTVAFQLSHSGHLATIDKDRTNLFDSCVPFLVDESTGEMVKQWNDKGEVLTTEYYDQTMLELKGLHRDDVHRKKYILDKLTGVDFRTPKSNEEYWANVLEKVSVITDDEISLAIE